LALVELVELIQAQTPQVALILFLDQLQQQVVGMVRVLEVLAVMVVQVAEQRLLRQAQEFLGKEITVELITPLGILIAVVVEEQVLLVVMLGGLLIQQEAVLEVQVLFLQLLVRLFNMLVEVVVQQMAEHMEILVLLVAEMAKQALN
jgi:hypothetical protein